MTEHTLHRFFEVFLEAYGIKPAEYLIEPEQRFHFEGEIKGFEETLKQCIRFGTHHEIVILHDTVSVHEFDKYLSESNFPAAVFVRKDERVIPFVILKDRAGHTVAVDATETQHVHYKINSWKDLPGEIWKDNTEEGEEGIVVVTCMPGKSQFRDNQDQGRWNLIRRFSNLLRYERREIGFIIVYAVIAGVISLSLPLGVQSIVSFVSSGRIATSVVVLIVFIVLGLLISGGMQVMQLYLAERIQQKLFAKTAFDFAFRIPRIKLESVLKDYPPELINRFFDIVTLQKGTATILLEFSAATLQIVFGLLLLSLYHPVFILLGLILILAMVFFLRVTGPRGLETSIKESKYKYKMANWLEELARSMTTFKLSGDLSLPMNKTDNLVSNYLYARNKHFKVLASQYMAFVLFKTLITGGLLVTGCVLIVEKEINLGQFIASEIVIILLMGAVEKIILKLDNIYDVLTSIDKISHVTDLPLEKNGIMQLPDSDKGIAVSMDGVKYKFSDWQKPVLNGLSFDVTPGSRVCISGNNGSGKTTLVNIMLGMLDSWEGSVTYDSVPLRDLDRDTLLSTIGDYVPQEEMFDGTLLENITLGRRSVRMKEVTDAIECVGLKDYVNSLPSGLNTRLVGGGMRVPGSIERKIIIARAIVGRPRLLILDDFLMGVQVSEKKRIMDHLIDSRRSWTVIVVSNDPMVMQSCGRVVFMKEGKMAMDGTYQELLSNSEFKELVNSRQ